MVCVAVGDFYEIYSLFIGAFPSYTQYIQCIRTIESENQRDNFEYVNWKLLS